MAEIGKEKETMMMLKVDLECSKCYKKVKKILCKSPQIRDTRFDEKSNTVIIKVVCCSPEKIMDKLCCQGGGSIKTIEIIEPPKPPVPKIDPPKPPKPPKEKPSAPPLPQLVIPVMPLGPPVAICCGSCYERHGGGPCIHGYGMPAQPYEWYGRPVCESWGGGPPPYRTCQVTICDYFSENNQQNCSIT